jgi:hypothetical protein
MNNLPFQISSSFLLLFVLMRISLHAQSVKTEENTYFILNADFEKGSLVIVFLT